MVTGAEVAGVGGLWARRNPPRPNMFQKEVPFNRMKSK